MFDIDFMSLESAENDISIEEVSGKDIAIVGIGVNLPDAEEPKEFFENILKGIDGIKPYPEERKEFSDEYIRCFVNRSDKEIRYNPGGYIEDIDKFDYKFFGISPKEASLTDPNHRILLETMWKAIEDGGYGGKKLTGSKTGVYVGYNADTIYGYKRFIADIEPSSFSMAVTGNLTPVLASRISYLLDFKGPSMTVDTACSSSLVAVHLACQAIRNSECEMALAGSVKLNLLPFIGEEKLGIESSDGRARAFDDNSDGTGMGEGAVAILLKPLNEAISCGDNIYAVIKGSAINQDGSSVGMTAPNVAAQEAVINAAWKNADIDPETITYIEAHGTGTKLGDPIEIEGITRAFRKYTGKKQFCAIGSLKTNIGHLDNASGIAGLVKAALAIKEGKLPPSLHFEEPNRNINFEDSPIYVNTLSNEWKTEGFPRRCGVSAFGLSGTNCHIIMEEAPEKEQNSEVNKAEYPFVISAKSEGSLKELIGKYIDTLSQLEVNNSLENVCYSAACCRGHYNYRLAMKAGSIEELVEKLRRIQGYGLNNNDTEYLYGQPQNVNEKQETALEELSLEELLGLYIEGADIDWEKVYGNKAVKKVRIPVYPFERKKCWLKIPDEIIYRYKNENDKFDIDKIIRIYDESTKAIEEYLEKNSGRDTVSGEKYKEIEKYYKDLVLKIFHDADIFTQNGATVSRKHLAEIIGVIPKYERLLDALLDILERGKFIEVSGDSIKTMPEAVSEKTMQRLASLEEVQNTLVQEEPGILRYMPLLMACVKKMIDILNGSIPAVNVVFPNGSTELVEDIYKEDENVANCNSMAVASILSFISGMEEYTNHSRPIRIIEVGAGTGGTTVWLLKELNKNNIKPEYCFTDISPALVERGRSIYGKENGYMEFKTFNLENAPETHGIESGYYDIVLAANVVHTTRNITDTIKRIKNLMRPGGLLMMIEGTIRQDYSTLTMGTLEGWWMFEDTDLRIPHAPMLSKETWEKVLEKCGYLNGRIYELNGGSNSIIKCLNDFSDVKTKASTPEERSRISTSVKNSQNHADIVLVGRDDGNYTQTEKTVGQVWGDILGFEEINIHDHFYDVGGDSIIAMKIVNGINQKIDNNLEFKDLLEYPTIEKLGKRLEDLIISQDAVSESKALTITPAEKAAYYPVTPMQKRMYLIDMMGNMGESYNIPGVVRIDGIPDKKKVSGILMKLLERNETLRTRFELVDNTPVQIIEDKIDFNMEFEASDEKDLKEIVKRFIRKFDLSKAPLFRAKLVEVKADRHYLLFDMHHIISDGISTSLIIRDFVNLYEDKALPELTLQYKDYSVWHEKMQQTDVIEKHEQYWLELFQDDIPVLNLPTDYQRPALQSFEGDRISFVLDDILKERLAAVAQETGTTMYMVLLSAYYTLLHRYTGQEDIIVGLPISIRPHKELENLIGMFVNTLALRNYPEAKESFRSFLNKVRESSLKAYENQEYQFEDLVEKLGIKRDLSRSPLFDTVFIYNNYGEQALTAGGVSFSPCEIENKTSKFDIAVTAIESNHKIRYEIEFCTALFKRETMERLSKHLIKILESIADNLDQRLCDIPILTENEKYELVYAFNESEHEYNKELVIHSIIESQVAKNPLKVAVECGNKSLTYGELNRKATMLAVRLKEKGITRNSIVALRCQRSVEMMVGILAVLKAGGAYLPIDPIYPEERVKYMLEDANVSILLTQLAVDRGQLTVGEEQITDERLEITVDNQNDVGADSYIRPENNKIQVIYLDDEELYVGYVPPIANENSAEDLAYVIYTSGSTGKPKGVMVEHRALNNFLSCMYRYFDGKVSEKDKCLSLTSISFDVSVCELFLPLVNGAKLVLFDKPQIEDLNYLADTIINKGITFAYIPPTILSDVAQLLGNRGRSVLLDKMLVGVEPIKDYVLYEYYKLNNDIAIINGYGPTESTICATFYKYMPEEPEGHKIPIGKPLDNNRIYILDKNNTLVPVGVEGELCIAGDGLARGYLNKPEMTAEKFVPNPFCTVDRGQLTVKNNNSEEKQPLSTNYELPTTNSQRMYRTGDLARWLPDGNIEFLGRIDHQVKIRGFRIELGEIENCILKNKEIKEAAVIARQDKDSNMYLCAYIAGDMSETPADIRRRISNELPYYMIPSYFVKMDKLPVSKNGKLDRKALPEPNILETITSEYKAPETEIEKELARAWQKVLGVEKIGVNDNYFELGGDSLKAIRIIGQLEGYSITMNSILSNPTIASLKDYVKKVENVSDNIPEIMTENLQLDYYFDKDGELDPIAEALDCQTVMAYFVFKRKIENYKDYMHLFIQDIIFYVEQDENGGINTIELETYPFRQDVFKLEGTTSQGYESIKNIEEQLDKGEQVIVSTFADRLQFSKNFKGFDYEYVPRDLNELEHVFMLVAHDDEYIYYVEMPHEINTKYFIPYHGNKSVGKVKKIDLKPAFDVYIQYATINIDQYSMNNGSGLKKLFEISLGNYNKAKQQNAGLTKYFGKEAMELLIQMSEDSILSLDSEQNKYGIKLYTLLLWKFTNIINRKRVISLALEYYTKELSDSEREYLLKSLRVLFLEWQEIIFFIKDQYENKENYIVGKEYKEKFIKIMELEDDFMKNLSKIAKGDFM